MKNMYQIEGTHSGKTSFYAPEFDIGQYQIDLVIL